MIYIQKGNQKTVFTVVYKELNKNQIILLTQTKMRPIIFITSFVKLY